MALFCQEMINTCVLMASPIGVSANSSQLHYDIQNASQFPRFCAKLADVLDEQEPFKGSGSEGQPCKVVCLDSRYDARIFHIFNKNARPILKNHSWSICTFGEEGRYLFDEYNRRLHGGVMLYLDNEAMKCSLNTLKNAYKRVLSAVRRNWKESIIEHHPHVNWEEVCSEDRPYLKRKSKDSREDFDLFVKKTTLIEEKTLILFIISRIAMQAHVKCHGDKLSSDNIYLWVRKSALDDVVAKFGFCFQKRQTSICAIS